MYNGTAYHGWQVQKNAVTVAETLEKALAVCVFPFIPFDLIKMTVALLIGVPVRRRLEQAGLL